jgi:hypothetical protein
VPTTTKSILTAPNGSETSLEKDSSRQVTLMTGLSSTCHLMTSEDIRSAISSPVSEDGATPSGSRCSQTIDLFGQDPAPASPSPQLAKDKHQAMNATSGPLGSSLSELADRQSSMANRLKRQLDGVGSILFTLTWRKKATPLGRPYYQLAASARRTSDSDCGSWPTPQAQEQNETPEKKIARGANSGLNLRNAAEMASWPTPRTTDSHGNKEHGQGGPGLHTVTGTIFSGSPAQTESKGQLNPAFSLWLMGYPAEWLSCAPLATQSSRKSRQSS